MVPAGSAIIPAKFRRMARRITCVAIVPLLAGCPTIEGPAAPEIRTTVVQVKVPTPVPCFTEDQRPVLPPATPVNPETATTEQLAAAELADATAMADYARAVDSLFLACLQKGTP